MIYREQKKILKLINWQLMMLFPLILIMTAACTDSGNQTSTLSIQDAWIREAPPGAQALAGYMKIINSGETPADLISVSSPEFSSIELHRSVFNNGVANMDRQKHITIPAHGQVELKPGDYHMMMFNPADALKSGDQTQVTLGFANGESLSVTLDVKKEDS